MRELLLIGKQPANLVLDAARTVLAEEYTAYEVLSSLVKWNLLQNILHLTLRHFAPFRHEARQLAELCFTLLPQMTRLSGFMFFTSIRSGNPLSLSALQAISSTLQSLHIQPVYATNNFTGLSAPFVFPALTRYIGPLSYFNNFICPNLRSLNVTGRESELPHLLESALDRQTKITRLFVTFLSDEDTNGDGNELAATRAVLELIKTIWRHPLLREDTKVFGVVSGVWLSMVSAYACASILFRLTCLQDLIREGLELQERPEGLRWVRCICASQMVKWELLWMHDGWVIEGTRDNSVSPATEAVHYYFNEVPQGTGRPIPFRVLMRHPNSIQPTRDMGNATVSEVADDGGDSDDDEQEDEGGDFNGDELDY